MNTKCKPGDLFLVKNDFVVTVDIDEKKPWYYEYILVSKGDFLLLINATNITKIRWLYKQKIVESGVGVLSTKLKKIS